MIHNVTLTKIGAIKMSILNQEIEFKVLNPDMGTGIPRIIGKSFSTLLKINIPESI